MNEQPAGFSPTRWQDWCPWVMIFRALSIAVSPTVLVWALLGVVATPIGWMSAEFLFFNQAMREDDALAGLAASNRSPYRAVFPLDDRGASDWLAAGTGAGAWDGIWKVADQLTEPFRAWFHSGWSFRELGYFGFGAVWSLLVWAFAGLAIARIAILRFTLNEVVGLDDSFDFACRKYLDCVGALAIPLMGVAALTLPAALLGLLMTFDLGVLVVGAVWALILVLSLLIVILMLGSLLGWPLMVSSVAAEGQNGFDATTRAFAYTLQRPLNYFGYALVAVAFGGGCWLLATSVTTGVIEIAYWTTSWGANLVNGERMDEIRQGAAETTLLSGAQRLIGFWNGLAKTLAAGFLYGLFWCLASAVYLLLRKDVDETEMDEVYLPEEQRSYALPDLVTDEMGVPQVVPPDGESPAGSDSPDA